LGASLLPEPSLDVFRPPGAAPAQGLCVLAAVDASPAGTHAAWRAALVARDRGAALHLLSVQADARELDAADAALQELAAHVQQRLLVPTTATAAAGRLCDRLAELAAGAGLVVLPWTTGRKVRDLLLGSLPERVFRALPLPLPVLVVRRPALASYRRVLVPVKLDADAVLLIAAARSVSRDPRMRVFHVLDTAQEGSLRLAGTSERALRLQRHRRSRTAYATLNELIARAGAPEAAAALVSWGHVPARVLEIARSGDTQLIVAGKERSSLLADLFFGGITQRLLCDAQSDLLVLPVPERSTVARWEAVRGPWPVA